MVILNLIQDLMRFRVKPGMTKIRLKPAGRPGLYQNDKRY
jgi:hypothetical protein